jgi:hypothetical protein
LPSNEAFITTDREKFAILTNLVKRDQSYRKGSVEFGYMIKDDFLEFYVKDTGTAYQDDKKQFSNDLFRLILPIRWRYKGNLVWVVYF